MIVTQPLGPGIDPQPPDSRASYYHPDYEEETVQMFKSIGVVSCLAMTVCSSLVHAGDNENPAKFGKTIKRTVYDDLPDAKCLIDFDKGEVAVPPGELPRSIEETINFFKESGFDASGEGDYLVGVEMIAKRVPNSSWDMATPEDINKHLASEKPKSPLFIRHDGKFPCTFVIKTHQGGQGLMRFKRLVPKQAGNPVGMELEYKLLRQSKAKPTDKKD